MAIMTEAKTADVQKLVVDAAQNGAVQARKMLNDGAAQAHVSMNQGVAQASKAAEGIAKAAEDAAEFGRGNAEALTQAAQTYMTGLQDLGRQSFALLQGLTDQAMANAKALSGVKSLQEAAELHTNFTRTAMEKTLAEGTKLQEAAMKLNETAFGPLTARMTAAVEKATRPLAA